MVGFWLLLVLLLVFCINSNYAEKCLDVPEAPPKRYMTKRNITLPITIDVSPRVTHQIISYIYKIFLEEELGYADVRIKEGSKNFVNIREINKRLENISSIRTNSQPNFSVEEPPSVLNLEVWVPPGNDPVVGHQVKLGGHVGPPGRFGWFIPKVLLTNNNESIFWKIFTTTEARIFAFDSSVFALQNYTQDSELRYYCEENYCSKGSYTPPECQKNSCAVLLAEYPADTRFIVKHIEKLKLLVQVVWVGPHLAYIVDNITPKLLNTSCLLVFLSFTPSTIVLPNDPAYATVVFPPCEHFEKNTNCKYELHALNKLHAFDFEKGAHHAYEAYERVTFSNEQYVKMLEMYKVAFQGSNESLKSVKTVACNWLKENKTFSDEWKKGQYLDSEGTLNIAGIFPFFPGTKLQPYGVYSIMRAASQATTEVNENKTLLRDYNLNLKVDDGSCDPNKVLKSFIHQIQPENYPNLVGILGPACSNTLEPLLGMAQLFSTVVISYSAEGSTFTDRNKYPYFFRTVGENNQFMQVYLQLLKKLNWKRLASLTEDGQKYSEYLTHLQDLLVSQHFNFITNRKFPVQRDRQAMRNYLEEMKSKSIRIIISDVYEEAARDMMCQAYKLEMTAMQSYVWFLPAWLSPKWYDTDSINKESGTDEIPCTTKEMLQAINGHFSLTHSAWAPDDAIMQTNQTVGEWKSKFKASLLTSEFSEYVSYAYDAVWMYALALDQLAKENLFAFGDLHSLTTTENFVKLLRKTDFNGLSGRVHFRGNTSRVCAVEVRQWVNGEINIVGLFEPNISEELNYHFAGTLHLDESKLQWLNPARVKPNDGNVLCVFGLADYFGFEDCNWFIVISNIILFLVLSSSVTIVFVVIKIRYDLKYKKTKHIIDSIGLDLLNVPNLEKWEIPRNRVVINRKLGEGAFGYVYGGEAYFDDKGWAPVAVKTLKTGSSPGEKLEFLCEAEIMKKFDHTNIVKLLGVCTKKEPVYTVMEFMLYGDLKTFLLARRHLVNEKLGEDAEEVSSKKLTSMALDVARALSYLAEQKIVHRDVASRNCMINATRVVKLGDFGMTRSMFDKDYYKFTRKGMLPVRWMAPESLEQGMFTPASDIWSYGVLLYEIITFGSFPFQGMANNEVLEYVKAGNTLSIPPKVKSQAEALMRSCWNLEYEKRPKAAEIVEFIANNPRLLHACLDVPLASVQIDGSGPVDIIHLEKIRKSTSLRHRKNSFVSNTPFQWGSSFGTRSTQPQGDLRQSSEEALQEWGTPLLQTSDKVSRNKVDIQSRAASCGTPCSP